MSISQIGREAVAATSDAAAKNQQTARGIGWEAVATTNEAVANSRWLPV